MESFNSNLQGGKKLVKSLEKQSVRARKALRANAGKGKLKAYYKSGEEKDGKSNAQWAGTVGTHITVIHTFRQGPLITFPSESPTIRPTLQIAKRLTVRPS